MLAIILRHLKVESVFTVVLALVATFYSIFFQHRTDKLVGLDQIRHNNRTDNLTTRVAYKLDLKG
ncbi:hypothetical protein [Nostoc sp.]